MNGLAQRIEPFRALMYADRFRGSLDQLVAPPYDLISKPRQDELYARSPENIIRLELNREPDRYAASAAVLARWLREAVLVRYPRPAIYLYTQHFEIEGRPFTRHGFIARVRLEEFGGRILPHEKTFPTAKKDRLELLAATRANISSIFALCAGEALDLGAMRARWLERAPLISVRDDLGIDNEIRALDEPDAIALVQRALASALVLIADGHHRYETALNYRRERRAQGAPVTLQSYDYTMMTLTSTGDPGVVILPTHRVVFRLPAEAAIGFAAAATREGFTLRALSDPNALLAALKDSGPGTIAVALKHDNSLRLLKLNRGASLERAMPLLPPEVRRLDVSILHALILDRIFGLKPAQVRAGGEIEYTIDARAALDAVQNGRADGAFLMNPPSIAEIEAVSAARATMPEKSTYFQPKLLTGLVLNSLDDPAP